MRVIDDFALVLSGGTFKAMFQIFIVILLEYLGVYPKDIWVTSAGGANSFGFVLGKAKILPEIWQEVEPRKLYDIDWWGLFAKSLFTGKLPVFGAPSIFESGFLEAILDREIDYQAAIDSPIALHIGVEDLRSGRVDEWPSTKDPGMTVEKLRNIIFGSMRVPVYFMPVEVGEQQLADVGSIANIPIEKAIEAGFSKIVAVNTLPLELSSIRRLDAWPGVNMRSDDIMHTEEAKRHLKMTERINRDVSVLAAIHKHPGIQDLLRQDAGLRKLFLNLSAYAKRNIDLCLISPPPTLTIFQKAGKRVYGYPSPEACFELLGAGAEAAETALLPFLARNGFLPPDVDSKMARWPEHVRELCEKSIRLHFKRTKRSEVLRRRHSKKRILASLAALATIFGLTLCSVIKRKLSRNRAL